MGRLVYFRFSGLFLPFLSDVSRQTMSGESYEFGNFRLDVTEHKLTRTDRPTNSSIPEKAFRTLVHLVRNPGILLTKEDLLNNVWKDVIVEENNLVKAIFAIRRFLEDMNDQAVYIETVP